MIRRTYLKIIYCSYKNKCVLFKTFLKNKKFCRIVVSFKLNNPYDGEKSRLWNEKKYQFLE